MPPKSSIDLEISTPEATESFLQVKRLVQSENGMLSAEQEWPKLEKLKFHAEFVMNIKALSAYRYISKLHWSPSGALSFNANPLDIT